MKLRLHDGSLRLRLSRPEIARLHDTGKVESAIIFGPGKELRYSIENREVPAPIATFIDSQIRVIVPTSLAMEWIESDQTGIETNGDALKLLIEKDFQCLHRPPEPGEDSFPNPLASA
jgi:hypothetical protein